IEVRVCDAMPTLKENMALAALIFLLVQKIGKEFENPPVNYQLPRWLLRENKWRAARYGIQGEVIINPAGETRKLKKLVLDLYDEMNEFAEQNHLGEATPYLSVIKEIVQKGPSYLRQLQWIRSRPGDYKFIVDNLQREFRENILLNGS
ncbi:MAG: carboxylate--amine ligase, partial [Calditrichia bacterium]